MLHNLSNILELTGIWTLNHSINDKYFYITYE